MGAEPWKTPIENGSSARISAPPGFAYLSSFFLKKVEHHEENSSFKASKGKSSTRDRLQIEATSDTIDVEKLKKSVGNRPWILNDKSDQIAKEYQSVQSDKATTRQCPGDAKGVVLEEAPVFHPSEQEFSDTLKYIESIRLRAEPYGICRIIPPPSWQPPCLIKEKSIWENSKFVTHIQQFDRFPAQSVKGNEPGPEFTLKTFKKHADDFSQHYFFSKHKDVGHEVNCKRGEPSVDSIESEYRQIVENPTGELEVLYGDNLDTASFGSGFPMASNPWELSNYPSYIRSSWNLNNVPKLPGSLLSFESDKTSGVLVPQLRIGMCFSSLYWKVEEHHLYSICYMHVGSPKIWYCIPGRYSFKFETLMKKYFPDLQGKQFKLHEGVITRLSPFILKSEGVPVYRCIHYPREFVLVFPGAYHSTFDCGFNVAEAVNFAPLDWLPHGQNAVALYQSQERKTSISFDKLLIGAAREAVKAQWELCMLKKNTIDNLRWKGYCGTNGILAETLKSRVKQEGFRREYLCTAFQTKRKDQNFNATGKRECSICSFDLFLSAAHCPCSADRYSCLNHAKRLCACTWTEKIFLYHYEVSELNVLVEAVEGKFSAVYTWAREDPNLGLHNYTPKDNSFAKDKGQKAHKLQDAGTSYGNGWTTASSIKAEIKARLQQSLYLNEQKSKEKIASTPSLPSVTQDDTSLFLREVMPDALSSSKSESSSSESEETSDLDLNGGKGCLISTLSSRLSPGHPEREITLSELRRAPEREVTLSELRRPPEREVTLSKLRKDTSGKHNTAKQYKSTSKKLPMSYHDKSGEAVAKAAADGNNNFVVETAKPESKEFNVQKLVDMFTKLNPSAKEFFPSSYHQSHTKSGNFNQVPVNKQGNENYSNRKRRNNYNQGRRKLNGRAFRDKRDDSIRRTVYVSDIDQTITEEQLAGLFSNCGQVVDCRVCGDPHSVLRFAFVEFADEEGARTALNLGGTMLGFYPVRVLPSKTAILPVNPTFLPQSEDEREMCTRTVYCTNIDKKVSQAEVKNFFESACGEVIRLRLLGDQVHSTRIAFVEFAMAESAIIALNCSGMVLGTQLIRVSPSKTPVRPRVTRPMLH